MKVARMTAISLIALSLAVSGLPARAQPPGAGSDPAQAQQELADALVASLLEATAERQVQRTDRDADVLYGDAPSRMLPSERNQAAQRLIRQLKDLAGRGDLDAARAKVRSKNLRWACVAGACVAVLVAAPIYHFKLNYDSNGRLSLGELQDSMRLDQPGSYAYSPDHSMTSFFFERYWDALKELPLLPVHTLFDGVGNFIKFHSDAFFGGPGYGYGPKVGLVDGIIGAGFHALMLWVAPTAVAAKAGKYVASALDGGVEARAARIAAREALRPFLARLRELGVDSLSRLDAAGVERLEKSVNEDPMELYSLKRVELELAHLSRALEDSSRMIAPSSPEGKVVHEILGDCRRRLGPIGWPGRLLARERRRRDLIDFIRRSRQRILSLARQVDLSEKGFDVEAVTDPLPIVPISAANLGAVRMDPQSRYLLSLIGEGNLPLELASLLSLALMHPETSAPELAVRHEIPASGALPGEERLHVFQMTLRYRIGGELQEDVFEGRVSTPAQSIEEATLNGRGRLVVQDWDWKHAGDEAEAALPAEAESDAGACRSQVATRVQAGAGNTQPESAVLKAGTGR